MDKNNVEFEVVLQPTKFSANELDDLSQQLEDEIRSINVSSIERKYIEEVPDGAMAVDLAQIGQFIVVVSPVLIPPLVTLIKAWIERQAKSTKQKSLRIQVKLGAFEFVLDETTSDESLKAFSDRVVTNLKES